MVVVAATLRSPTSECVGGVGAYVNRHLFEYRRRCTDHCLGDRQSQERKCELHPRHYQVQMVTSSSARIVKYFLMDIGLAEYRLCCQAHWHLIGKNFGMLVIVALAVSQLSKSQRPTANYDSVRADEIYETMTSDKRVLLQPQSMKSTQNAKFKMYPCCLYIGLCVSQSIDKSIRRVRGTCCMSLRQFYTPEERNTVHLSEVIILFFSAAVRVIHCTMRLWKFCNYVI